MSSADDILKYLSKNSSMHKNDIYLEVCRKYEELKKEFENEISIKINTACNIVDEFIKNIETLDELIENQKQDINRIKTNYLSPHNYSEKQSKKNIEKELEELKENSKKLLEGTNNIIENSKTLMPGGELENITNSINNFLTKVEDFSKDFKQKLKDYIDPITLFRNGIIDENQLLNYFKTTTVYKNQ